MSLDGKHALVTGGSRGIGAAVARALAESGADVTITARNAGALESARGKLDSAWPDRRFHSVVMDVTDGEAVAKGFEAARAALGPVSILVNNAGAAESAAFTDTDEALFRRMVEVNLTGTFLCCRQVLGAMLDAGFGRIINVASSAGLAGYKYVSAYVAAKHGVVGLTRSLALETTDTGVTVNALCPGYVDTEMTAASARAIAKRTGRDVREIVERYAETNPSGRLIAPEAVARKVIWLCLPEQSTVTGRTFSIDDQEEET